MKKNKILITNHHLKNFEGSEIHCLELAEYFIERGFDVDVAAFRTGKPIIEKFQNLGIRVRNLNDLNRDNDVYDLVWSHHRPVFHFLHFHLKIQSKHFIHQLLSPFLELEFYPLFQDSQIDERLIFFANSKETKRLAIRQSGNEKIRVLHNSIPETYFQKRVSLKNKPINKIAIISNHPPIEIRAAMDYFTCDGVSVEFYGMKDKIVNISPELLSKFDLVITIGKTVQYCFASMVPVYNYDYHGGGYISLATFDDLEFYNFSGRFPGILKSPEFIYQEITSGYAIAVKELTQIQKEARSRYRLSTQLSPFLDSLNFTREARELDLSESEKTISVYVEKYVRKSKFKVELSRIILNIKKILKVSKHNP